MSWGIGSRVERADGKRGEVVALTLYEGHPVVKVQWEGEQEGLGWRWASQYRILDEEEAR